MSITVRANSQMVGNLFSGMNAGFMSSSGGMFSSIGVSMMGGLSYSDYASLKNGSYHKLLNYYYSLENGGSDKKASSVAGQDHKYWSLKEANENKKKYNYWNYQTMSTSKEGTSKLATIESDAGKLSDAADRLLTQGSNSVFKQTADKYGDGTLKYNTDAIYKAVSNYVNQYNDLIQSAGGSNVTAISASVASMKDYTNSNAQALAEIGITIDAEKQTLSLNETTFKNADMNQVKSLFQGSGSYAYKVSQKASAIDYHAQYEAKKANTYNGSGNYANNNTSGSMYNSAI